MLCRSFQAESDHDLSAPRPSHTLSQDENKIILMSAVEIKSARLMLLGCFIHMVHMCGGQLFFTHTERAKNEL